ncbi:MAG: FHA domain-containing protein [Candidatus Nanopelagicales bacterium]
MTTAVPGDQSETAGDVNPAFSKATDITGTIHALGTTPSDTGPLDPVGGEHSESVEPGQHVLYTVRGPGSGTRVELIGDEVTVGRSPEAGIFLDDITVSRIHAAFIRSGDTWEISDKGSLNGTYVNRSPVDSHVLEPGDEIQVGKYRFKYLSSTQDDA